MNRDTSPPLTFNETHDVADLLARRQRKVGLSVSIGAEVVIALGRVAPRRTRSAFVEAAVRDAIRRIIRDARLEHERHECDARARAHDDEPPLSQLDPWE